MFNHEVEENMEPTYKPAEETLHEILKKLETRNQLLKFENNAKQLKTNLVEKQKVKLQGELEKEEKNYAK